MLAAWSSGLTSVVVRFSDRLSPGPALRPENYILVGPDGPVPVLSASLSGNGDRVVLSSPTLSEGALYTLVVSNFTDRAAAAHAVPPGNVVAFRTTRLQAMELGTGQIDSVTVTGDGLIVRAQGTGWQGPADAGSFLGRLVTGDFDLRVRAEELEWSDAAASAGVIVREGTDAAARSAGVMATPTGNGGYFVARTNVGESSFRSGRFPGNPPFSWLRLCRVGHRIEGFAGVDGRSWRSLGWVNLDLPPSVWVELGLASAVSNRSARAVFREFSPTLTAAGLSEPAFESPGPCSRLTGLVIAEIMYHPTNPALEFVELMNTRAEPEDISGYRLDGSIQYTFPPGTVLAGGGIVVVALDPGALQAAYGLTGVLGPWSGRLPNDSGRVQLRHRTGAVFLNVDYRDRPPWPVAADGAGPSLVLARPSLGERDPRAWRASGLPGGSPGAVDGVVPDPRGAVRINEFLAHTDPPQLDFVELYHAGTEPVDLGGCVLTDDPARDRYVFASPTILAPGGYLVLTENELGFGLSAQGETLYLRTPDRRVLDAVRFEGQALGVSSGRWPDGNEELYPLTRPTPGGPNAAPRVGEVILNEIYYHPVSRDDEDQFVELHNRTDQPVSLAGWELEGGIRFVFPDTTQIAPRGHLVVARNAGRLMERYPWLNASNLVGNFEGRLSHRGERLALRRPELLVRRDAAGQWVTNLIRVVVDEVSYRDGGRWPVWADGGGSSLERVHPDTHGRHPAHWADSDETGKAPWTVISATGTVDLGSSPADQLQVLLMGAGECLIDDVQVLTPTGSNLVANSTFESGASGWTAEGTMAGSGWEPAEGYQSARSYRIRAVDRGDNQINRVRTPLRATLSAGTTNVTLRAAVRWLRGHPQILLRLRGNWLECAGAMVPTPRPGTPGLPNSRDAAEPPVAVGPVRHEPVLPGPSEPIRIVARVDDPHGRPEAWLWYRLDPATNAVGLLMNDEGRDGDQMAGDGLYTGVVPGQPAGTMVAFWIEARRAGTGVTARFPADAPVRECLVRVGELQPAGSLPVYRIWMTRATLNRWTSRHKLDNTPLDVTFVSGADRVIYNTGAMYAGSPYIAPGFSSPLSGRCGYSLEFPKDDRFLGDTDLVLDWPGGHGGETTAIQEQMTWWLADQLGLPYSHRYHIRLHVNGVTDDARQAIFEAVHQPGRSFVEAWSPDQPEGQFFKIDRAFEFSDGGSLIADPMPRLENYTTTGGVKKRERYRWTWMYRATPRVHDYTNLFVLVDALNAPTPEPYTSAVLGLVDLEQWMRMFAFEHIIVNFDSWGHEIGKNMYMFLPRGGRWVLYAFDLDWLMLVSPRLSSRFLPDRAALFTSDDPTVARMYAHPPFQRAYWRAVRDAVLGPMDPSRAHPVMDAKYQVLRAHGVRWCDGQPLTDPSALKTWFAQRRVFLQAQLATVAAPFVVRPRVTLSNGLAVLSGTAPVEVLTVGINGSPWSVQWTTATNWVAVVPVQPGSNGWTVTALDTVGRPIPGLEQTVSVMHELPQPAPEDWVVIHEILYRPRLPGAAFVELFNRSPTHGFDLSGWQMEGLDYTFPGGTFLPPQGYLVLAADRAGFMTAFGPEVVVFDRFGTRLDEGGKTIGLLRPGVGPGERVVVDRVWYESGPPWPEPAPGQSLQLIDPARENDRVANWAIATGPTTGPELIPLLAYDGWWRYQQTTNLDEVAWTEPGYEDLAWPVGRGLLGFENNSGIVPMIRTGLKDPRQPTNSLPAGHAYYFRTPVVVTQALTGYVLTASAYVDDGAVFHVNGREVYRLRMPLGEPVRHDTLATAQPPGGDATSPDVFTLPASVLRSGTNIVAVSVHQQNASSSDVVFGLQLVATRAAVVAVEATPGRANATAGALPPFPTLWLNEVQAENLTGPADRTGQREPWVEIYNPGREPVSLQDVYLSDRYDQPGRWAFPPQASVPGGGFVLVWCDGEPVQSTQTEWHANFRLAPLTGSVVLSRRLGEGFQVLDYINYTQLAANRSYGSYPDGQPFYRGIFPYATPGASNNPTSPRIQVLINEWLADNARVLADPADGDFEDWFELYNAGEEPVDLGGYYVTDHLGQPARFRIPATGQYVLPPRGFLLVWADNEPEQNSPQRPDLHVNFALARAGEAIGLFAPDLTPVDVVSFGPQETDVSQGRYPDGSATVYTFQRPTPRAPNQLPNTPPRLQPVGDQTLYLGQTLQLRLIGHDDDQPAQALTFLLGPDAPAGATLHPQTGWLFWTPTTAPLETWFEVLLTDDGQPPLSSSVRFRVAVRPRPMLELRAALGRWELHWSEGILQEADEITGPWRDVSMAPPHVVSFDSARKFYRVGLAP